jgi:starvation-inducible DNA-binding protein
LAETALGGTANEPKENDNMKLNIELTEKSREGAVTMLNALLADDFVLGTRTRNCHWNVTGPHFHDLHKLFASQYDALDEIMDDVAERARALGGHAVGTLSELLALARLKERPGKYPSASHMTAELLTGHEAVIRQLRADVIACDEKLADAGTTDFLTGLMEQHEKMAWMLRAVLEEKNQAQTNGAIRPLKTERK